MHQPLLQGDATSLEVHTGNGEAEVDHDAATEAHTSYAARPGAIAFVLGALITGAALTMHYSGFETVDLSWQDDQCFAAPAIKVSGLVVDACLNRQTNTEATDCGRPAADAFCKLIKANYVVNFTLDDIPKDVKRGALTLGNAYLGGRVVFAEVCCDAGSYRPQYSRMLLLAGGALLLYAAAVFLARMTLRTMEVLSAWMGLEAGEVVYFLLGVESPLRWLLYSLALVEWVSWVLWSVWCGAGVDCESHGSQARSMLLSLAQVMLLFSAGALVAKAAPRVISVRYLYAGEFARVRETMRNEGLLDALTHPEVRDVILSRRHQQQLERQSQAAATAPAPTPGATGAAGGAHAPGDGCPVAPVGAAGRTGGGRKGKGKGRGAARGSAGSGVKDISSILAGGPAPGGAVDRFRSFLDRYSALSEEQMAEQAAAQGTMLYENLVGAWDLDLDGSVGRDDFLELFKRVGAPPGFKSPASAARAAWALFDLDQDGRLGRNEFVHALAQLFRERANTARTVLSNESAVRSLETAIGGVLYTLLAFAAARILGYTSGTSDGPSSLDFFTTYVLALSFIFGDTVRSIFRSTLYLFAEQPYSVGDCLELDGDLWMVVSFDLLFTQLRKWEYNQYAKVPNDQLIDSKLVNVTRGGAFKDTVSVSAPLALPTEAIREIKSKLLDAGAARPKDIVSGSPHIKVDSIDSGQVMTLMMEWVYAFPPGDRQRVDDTREYMVAACKDALVEVGMTERGLNLDFRLAAKKPKAA